VSDDQQLLEKYLEVISERERSYHSSLWEEEKHYTWWVYILFAGLIYLYISHEISNIIKFILIFGLSLFGIWISLAAINAIRRDGEAFCVAHQIFQRAIIALGLDKYKPNPPESTKLYEEGGKEGVRWQELSKVKSKAKKCGYDSYSRNWSIRYFFQVTFWITLVFFVLSFIYNIFGIIFGL
jgi:hypothetical protein